jgi:hypothetical protein
MKIFIYQEKIKAKWFPDSIQWFLTATGKDA